MNNNQMKGAILVLEDIREKAHCIRMICLDSSCLRGIDEIIEQLSQLINEIKKNKEGQ